MRSFVTALFLILLISALPLSAQTIQINLINGRTGNPMSHAHIDLGTREIKNMVPISTDDNGIARFRLTTNKTEITVQDQSHQPAQTSPVVNYSDEIHVHAGYVLCESRKADYSWLAVLSFSTQQILQHGIVTANTCGKAVASPQPGQVTIFVRPLTWWEAFKQ